MIKRGDCIAVLRTLRGNSVDAVITDPPAGISFMGKSWDHDRGGRKHWIAWMTDVMAECLRVLKPGGHALVWALPRTSHWTATALEDAGFEIRDIVTHIFGSGFPKSLDVSKAMDKAAGAEREVIGHNPKWNSKPRAMAPGEGMRNAVPAYTAPATDLAKQWQGWGTALKPASEHWILVRKPLSEKNVAENVKRWGVGGINIDGCRVGFASDRDKAAAAAAAAAAAQRSCQDQNKGRNSYGHFKNGPKSLQPYLDGMSKGRFPANLILSPEAARELDRQSGVSCHKRTGQRRGGIWESDGNGGPIAAPGDSGGASRFFYVAKPSKRERNAGLSHLAAKTTGVKNASGRGFSESDPYKEVLNQNHHPTVKPIALMRYLIRMVTPPGGLVLDPFMGSGTTGCAAKREGMRFIGIERDKDYIKIARARLKAA